LFHSVLLGSALALASTAAYAADRSHDIGVSVGNVDVDVGLGDGKGLDADVDASIGGKDGVNANADVSLGDKNGVDADVDVSLGNENGVDADVDLSLGGDDGVDADVTAGIGNDVDVDLGVGVDNPEEIARPGVNPGAEPEINRLTLAQRKMVNAMSQGDRKAMMKRCGSVSSGGYDPALIQLCKLLRVSASR
jgi:hypothetical protein